MAVLSLPLAFTNSFWTQDYRKGLEVLYNKLEQGLVENHEIVAFIKARAAAEAQIATSLQQPVPLGSHGAGFNKDDGASLLMAFRGLQAESETQGQVHKDISKDLRALVADPFNEWARGYEERLASSKAMVMSNWLRAYEDSQKEVIKLKNSYLQKTRRADEAEDDVKFAPNNDLGDHYTTSPRLAPRDKSTQPQRSATVSERIAQRFKEIQRKAAGASISSVESDVASETSEEKPPAKVDKGKRRAVESPSPSLMESPPPLSPPLPPTKMETASPLSMDAPLPPTPILLAGLAIPPASVSALLSRAATELKPRSIRFPLLGEYPDCFTGEEFVAWLNVNVPGFDGSLDRAEDAARELTERDGLLRRIGEFGNEFEHSDEAFYQFRPKAFELGSEAETAPPAPKRNLAPLADNLFKRSNNFVNVVSKALNANSQSEPAHVRLREEAEEADKIYRVAVRKLDRQRLGLEERIEETLKTLQRGEMERLRAVKTVLLQYQGTLATIPKAFEPSIERSATLVASYQPDADLTALMERYRTGPFRPVPQLYESVAHDESDVVFGIDLRKWAEGGWNALTSGEEKKDLIPPVLTALLNALNEAYDRLPNDSEKRKTWIYEVPLPALHHLREALNAVPPEQPFSPEMLAKYDVPVLAGGIKLWALELDPPLALWEGWDDIRKLYPTVGSAKTDGEASEQQHLQDLQVALQRLPKVHLYVLDAIVSHLRNLIQSTTVEEADDIYFTKLALSVGRTIIKPKVETELSIQDRHPTLLFIDLLKNYDDILPPTIAKKKRESERRVPVRKRTAPIDMRMSRGRISVGAPTREILAAQQAAQKVAAQVPGAILRHFPEAPRAAVQPSPISESKSFSSEPETEAAVEESEQFGRTEPEIIPPPAVQDDSAPPRPTFKEPPPEIDDAPPRPMFKEPPPELDDIPSPSMQPLSFVSPPASPPPVIDEKPPSPAVSVTPATPHNPMKGLRRASIVHSGSASPVRSPSPLTSPAIPADDQALSAGKSGLSRHSSGQAAVRGPRLSRGPRPAAGGGTVSSMVANLNRSSMSKSPPPSPNYKRLSGGTTRPASMLGGADGKGKIGRSGVFARRAMASDAEDDVLDRA
ncbi:uncharacterized protein EDB91DRAFT_1118048 [Suillus paluster]|uniref:uncharacterized protein n=1 Tax=Suillus paluster TaxID=48578 RepID=UPI001B878223|nr:uncharacterized protein EDB91DRAFT_1118048 [Suillus paluster]KAG1746630.1 hypothetical protein EDB91DRAFT_1118048 [Suillus paluster]